MSVPLMSQPQELHSLQNKAKFADHKTFYGKWWLYFNGLCL